MAKKKNYTYIVFIVLYFLFFGAVLLFGGFYDLRFSQEFFNPQDKLAGFMEIWGEAPRFAMWAPAAAVLLLTRHSLAECIGVIHKIFPFVPEISEKAQQKKAYKISNQIVNIVEILGFTVLTVLGCDKLIRNVGKYYVDLSRAVWYLISAVAAVVLILIFSRIPKRILNKLEPIALMGILIGILYLFTDPIKHFINRARFREMVAFSFGIPDAKDAAVNNSLVQGADYSNFTNWYQKGMGGSFINGIELGGTSCPSGHVMSGCFIFISAVICSAFKKIKKLTVPACVLSFAYVTALSFTRIVRGAHFLTDVSLGAIIGMIFFLFALGVLKSFEKKNILPVR